jgi:hypothetical protein
MKMGLKRYFVERYDLWSTPLRDSDDDAEVEQIISANPRS